MGPASVPSPQYTLWGPRLGLQAMGNHSQGQCPAHAKGRLERGLSVGAGPGSATQPLPAVEPGSHLKCREALQGRPVLTGDSPLAENRLRGTKGLFPRWPGIQAARSALTLCPALVAPERGRVASSAPGPPRPMHAAYLASLHGHFCLHAAALATLVP